MTETGPDDWERIYERWSTERLLGTLADEADQFNPAALPIMRRVLERRGVAHELIDTALEQQKSAAAEPQAPRFTRVRGWLIVLALFIFWHSLFFVIFPFAVTISDWRAPLAAIPVFAIGLYGFYCDYALVIRQPQAPGSTRQWLALAMLAGLLMLLPSRLSPTGFDPAFSLLLAPIWIRYLSRSKRVVQVYGDPSAAPALRAAPSATETQRDPATTRALAHRLLGELLEVPPERRVAWLEECCPDDPALRRRILAALPRDDSSRKRESPGQVAFRLPTPVLDTPVPSGTDRLIGARLGPWEVLEKLEHHRGMSVVYRGRRADGMYTTPVAIKVIPFDPDFLGRFARERQLLAQLDHPCIVRILDAGTTPDERPYLVMEWVDGQQLDEYAKTNNPNLSTRLHLFLSICDAVQYAHQNSIVHRDLKPGNILVRPNGSPKILDFGLATLVSSDAPGASMFRSQPGELAFTPKYASPEQIQGQRVTTATDVHALGMALYELLTGAYPFPSAKPSSGHRDIERIICSEAPPAPSRATVAGLGIAPRLLQGDLDSIVLQALRKEATTRYQTVKDLAEDVTRFLTRRPVQARKQFGYRARKLLQAYALPVGIAATLIGALATSLVVTIRGNRESARMLGTTEELLANSLVVQSLDPALSRSRSLELALRALTSHPDNHAARFRVATLIREAKHVSRHFESIAFASFDSTGRRIVVGDGPRVRILTPDLRDVATIDHPVDVSSAAFDAAHMRVAVGSRNGDVKVWTITPDGPLFMFEGRNAAAVTGLAFPADGGLVVGGGHALERWSAQGARVHRQEVRGDVIDVSPAGTRALVDDGSRVSLINVTGGAELYTVNRLGTSARFSGNGDVVVIKTRNGMVEQRESETGPLAVDTYVGAGATLVALARGRTLVTAEEDGSVRFLTASGIDARGPLVPSAVDGVGANPSTSNVLVWNQDEVGVWNIDGVESADASGEEATGGAWSPFKSESADAPSYGRRLDRDHASSLIPDAALGSAAGITLGGAENTIVLTHIESGREIARLHFTFSPSTRWTISATGNAVAADRELAKDSFLTTVWTLAADGRFVGNDSAGRLLALSRDGRTAALAENGRLVLRDARTGIQLQAYELFSGENVPLGAPTHAAFAADGSRINVAAGTRSRAIETLESDESPERLIAEGTALQRQMLANTRGTGEEPRETNVQDGPSFSPGTCADGCCRKGRSLPLRFGGAKGTLRFVPFLFPGADCSESLRLTIPGAMFTATAVLLREAVTADVDNDGSDELVLVDEGGGNGNFYSTTTVLRAGESFSAVKGGQWDAIATFEGRAYGSPTRKEAVVFRDLDGDRRRETVCVVRRTLDESRRDVIISATRLSARGKATTIGLTACQARTVGTELFISNSVAYPIEVTVRAYADGQSPFDWRHVAVKREGDDEPK